MKTLKRLALRALLSKEQRVVILNSVMYSEHKYKAHGDVEGAVRVGIVRKELQNIITAPEKKKFTEKQVNAIVTAVLCDFVDWLRHHSDKKVSCVAVGTVVEKEKCDKCEHRDECAVNKALFHDDDDKGKSAEGEDTANAQKNDDTDQTGAPEGGCDTVGTQAAAAKIAEEQEEQNKSEE